MMFQDMKNSRLLILLGLLFIALFAISLNLFPHFYAYLHTPNEMVFSGQASWFDPWDVNVYVAAIRSGASHGVTLTNLYTSTPNVPIVIYPVYTLAGALFGRLIDVWILFYLLSAICTVAMTFSLYFAIKVFIKQNQNALVAVFLTLFGGGIGWMLFPVFQSSDLFVTGFTFISSLQRPHEAIGMMLYIGSIVTSYLAINCHSTPKYILTLLLIIGTVVFYPYYAISFLVIFGIWTMSSTISIYRTKSAISVYHLASYTAIAITVTVVTVLYYLHVRSNPTFSSVVAQILPQPNIINNLFGYGVLAIVYLLQLWKGKRDKQYYFLNMWVMVSVILSLVPLGFTRFYLRSLYLPIVIFAVTNIDIVSRVFSISKRFVAVCLVILVPISSFFIFYKRISEVNNNNSWYYISKSEKAGLDYLVQNQSNTNGVLASYKLGNMIPAFATIPVYFGHLFQTPNAKDKLDNLYRFYTKGYTSKDAQTWLNQARICYVVYSVDEIAIASENRYSSDLSYPFLQEAFRDGKTAIYRNIGYCTSK